MIITIKLRNLKTQTKNTTNNICQKSVFNDVNALPSKNA